MNLSEIKSFEELALFVEQRSVRELQAAALKYWGDQSVVCDFLTNWGSDLKNSYYSAGDMLESIRDMKEYFSEYRETYMMLADEASKALCLKLYIFKLCGDRKLLGNAFRSNQYFYEKFVNFREDEVLVDCGAYDGRQITEFMVIAPQFKRVYAYEPNLNAYSKLKDEYGYFICEGLIGLKNAAVNNECGTVSFVCDKNHPGSSRISTAGDTRVQSLTIDDDIKEPVTFIKMDVEGAEKQALIGAKRHIAENTPKLAVSVYHLVDDLWKIPELIRRINPSYEFYLRHHGGYSISNLVLYCIPLHAKESTGKIQVVREPRFYEELLRRVSSHLHSSAFNSGDDGGWGPALVEGVNALYDTAHEGKLWMQELQAAKDWLEGQYLNYKKLYEEKEGI